VDTAPLQAKLAANPDDHASRIELARAHAAGGEYREAFEAALEVTRRDRDFDEQAGRKLLLQFFEMLAGNEQHKALVREFRRRLSSMLN
jgi:putative thioredoxin